MMRNGSLIQRTGFVLIEGTPDQISGLTTSDDFHTRINRVTAVSQQVVIDYVDSGERVNKRMELYAQTLKQMNV
jgi:hypothetical protein